MEQILGTFYFTQAESGNLLGEFINNKNPNIISESADIECSKTTHRFIGCYKATWNENGIRELELKINYKKDTHNLIYELFWKSKEKTIFEGYGFVTENKLIGCYKNTVNNSK